MSQIVWETPRNGYGNPVDTLRLGTMSGSNRQYLMQQQTPDGWTVATREHHNAEWVPFPLTATDLAVAVAHRVEVLALGPTHPDAIAAAIDADTDTVDELAEVIHQADWMMAGGEWRFCEATATEKDQSRRIACTVLAAHATTHPLNLRQSVERIIRDQWTTAPRHGAARRIAAKTDKAVAWLRANTPNYTSDYTSEKAPC